MKRAGKSRRSVSDKGHAARGMHLSATTEINDDPEGVDQPKKGEVITLDAFRKKRT